MLADRVSLQKRHFVRPNCSSFPICRTMGPGAHGVVRPRQRVCAARLLVVDVWASALWAPMLRVTVTSSRSSMLLLLLLLVIGRRWRTQRQFQVRRSVEQQRRVQSTATVCRQVGHRRICTTQHRRILTDCVQLGLFVVSYCEFNCNFYTNRSIVLCFNYLDLIRICCTRTR